MRFGFMEDFRNPNNGDAFSAILSRDPWTNKTVREDGFRQHC